MQGEFVRSVTEDGLELQGLLGEPEEDTETAVLYVHGWNGNFYEHRFVDRVGERLVDAGWGYLMANTRGHDYMSQTLTVDEDGEYDFYRGGGVFETFEECVHDVDGWLSFLEGRGYADVYLLCHSVGAQKAVYYRNERDDDRIAGLGLLSPPNEVGMLREWLGEDYEAAVELAREMVADGRERDLMPGTYLHFDVSAGTFLDMFGPETDRNVFAFDRGELAALEAIEEPILVTYGSRHEPVDADQAECLETIEAAARNATSCTTAIVDGAPHAYLDREDELARVVERWLSEQTTGG